MKTKLAGRFRCAVTLFSLIGQVARVVENMYFEVIPAITDVRHSEKLPENSAYRKKS